MKRSFAALFFTLPLLGIVGFYFLTTSAREGTQPGLVIEKHESLPWYNVEGIPVLCYHQIVNDPAKVSDYAIHVDRFREQMKFLKENGYETVSAGELLNFINSPDPSSQTGRKKVLITFDDGLRDFSIYAQPILENYGFSATLFVYPTYIASGKKRVYRWNELKKLSEQGYDIESHTYWHPLLNTMNEKEENKQFALSKKIIEQNVGNNVTMLAYPFGVHTAHSVQLLKDAGYNAAFTIFAGENLPGEDPYLLSRYLVGGTQSLSTFRSKLEQRTLPVQNINPPPGSQLPATQTIRLSLPSRLDPQSIRVFVFSTAQRFSYDPDTGTMNISLNRSGKKISVLRIQAEHQGRKFQKEILYNHI